MEQILNLASPHKSRKSARATIRGALLGILCVGVSCAVLILSNLGLVANAEESFKSPERCLEAAHTAFAQNQIGSALENLKQLKVLAAAVSTKNAANHLVKPTVPYDRSVVDKAQQVEKKKEWAEAERKCMEGLINCERAREEIMLSSTGFGQGLVDMDKATLYDILSRCQEKQGKSTESVASCELAVKTWLKCPHALKNLKASVDRLAKLYSGDNKSK